MPNDAAWSTINSLLPEKLTRVLVPVAAATSSVAPVCSWKRPVLLGLIAEDISNVPATLTTPLSKTFGVLLVPPSVQFAPASTVKV